MFTQACFIRKNTYDLRHSLNNMGKTNCTQRVFPILVSNYEIYYGVHDFEESIDNLMLNGFIDCGTNEELFLSIAALRDDSDVHQLFIMDAEIYTEISKGDWFVATDIKDYFFIIRSGYNPSTCIVIIFRFNGSFFVCCPCYKTYLVQP